MAEKMKSVENVEKPKPVRKLTVKRGGKTEVIEVKRNDLIVACADYMLYGDGVVNGETDKCIVAYHDHVSVFDYEDVTGLLGLDSYSAEAYGVHIKRDSEKIEVIGDVIAYRDRRGNKFTYRKRGRGLADFLIID
jgi:hypothetical protein